jgi:hypothetical protein
MSLLSDHIYITEGEDLYFELESYLTHLVDVVQPLKI